MSRPGGINTPDHSTHNTGRAFDMRPLRNDSLTGNDAGLNYNSNTYHRDYTKEFIRLVKKLYPSIFIRFNDDLIAGKGDFTYVHKDFKGGVHNDHLRSKKLCIFSSKVLDYDLFLILSELLNKKLGFLPVHIK